MYLKSILNKVAKYHFYVIFYFELAVRWSKSRIFKNYNWNMPKIPSKMDMYDMVKIDNIVFEIVGGGGGDGRAFKAPPGSLAV